MRTGRQRFDEQRLYRVAAGRPSKANAIAADGLQPLLTEHFHGSRAAIVVHRNRYRRGLRAGGAGLCADLPRHQRRELRAGRILDGRGLFDGGVRRRSGMAVLALLPAGAGRHGAIGRDLQSRGLLSAASPHFPAGNHCDHRRLDPARQLGARDLRAAAAGAGGVVRDAGHSARAGLSRQPVSPDHRRHDRTGDLQLLVLRTHRAGVVPDLPASGHLRRTRRGEGMSAPSENMPIAAVVPRARPLLLRHLPYFIGAAILVTLAATMRFDGYIHNILMQATTFAIAVFGLSVVLGLCGQINLAQAAFFGLGAYVVGLGTPDYHLSYWLCLAGGCVIALLAGAVLGMSTLRLGGHYLAMVTISFQQIVTLVMVNTIWLTHGPDGGSRVGPPDLFPAAQSLPGFSVALLGPGGFAVWHLPDTRLGRAMRAVRDNELAAGVNGIDVFRTKVYAFALCALLGGLAGGLFAGGFAYISPDQFSFAESIVFLTMSLLGGVASPIGAAIGTGLLILIPEWLRFLMSIPGLYLAIYGLSVIPIIRFIPDGIWGVICV